MDAAAWAAWSIGALTLPALAYSMALFRALRNEHVISGAIVTMRVALTADPSPERELLSAVADAMAAQERAAARVEAAIHEIALRGDRIPDAGDLLAELLSLPEPQLLIAGFLREHAGGPGSDAAFASVAGDMLRTATVKAFGDLADQGLVELDSLLVLADEGRIARVARAGFNSSLDPNPLAPHVPGLADLDRGAAAAIVRALDWTTRRQLRLATVLHGQAEAMLGLPRSGWRDPAALWIRLRTLVKFPPPRRPEFQPSDLEALEIAFNAVGEVVDLARELLADGQPMKAAHLLAGLRIPVPPGLPGRMYLQESLAQVRSLARFGVWHRLAVCRWAASTLEVIAHRDAEARDQAGSSDASVRDGTGEP